MNAADLLPEERRARGTLLCEQLTRDIESVAPDGIGRWDRCWQIVAGTDAVFVLALSTWEGSPGPATRARVRQAYENALAAWRCAAAEYEVHRERTG